MTKTLRQSLTLVLLPLLLVFARPVEASVNAFWKELGGSATGGAVSQLAPPRGLGNGVGVAAGADGRPIVIYTDSAFGEDGRILAKRWTGSAWQMISPAAGINDPAILGEEPQIVISPAGTLFAAWSTREPGGSQVHLRRRAATGTVWEELDGSDAPGGLTGINGSSVTSFSLAVGDDDLPVVAFAIAAQKPNIAFPVPGIVTGQSQVYVKKYMGASQGWQYLGSDPFGTGNTSAGGASEAASFIVAGSDYAQHSAHGPSLVIDSAGRPTVAFVYETAYPFTSAPAEFVQGNSEIFVTRYDNGAWMPVGPAVPSSDSGAGRGGPGGVSNDPFASLGVSVAASAGGVLWTAWQELSGTSAIFVRRWNGTDTWEEVAAGSATGGGIAGLGPHAAPRIDVDASDRPIVMWQNFAAQGVVFVRRFDGTDWLEMGPDSASGDGITGNDAYRMAMAVSIGTGSSTVNVAWLSSVNSAPAQARLRQFFTGPSFLLSVGISPGGAGQVASSPIGIFCPDDSCSEFYPTGQAVSLTAIPGPDTLFDKWTGACTGSAACSVSMTAARSVNASFVSAATLTVARTGLGTVSGSGIACGADCEQKYRSGTPVNLTVTMPAGTLFGGWGGACSFRGTNTSCALTMLSNTSVSASFSQRVYGLSVAGATPPGTVGQGVIGNIVGSGGGADDIGCSFGGSGTCSAGVEHGTRVILSALPATGNSFLGWTGAPCAGRTNATCEFTMLANYSTTALFRGVTAINVSTGGNGTGLVTGPSINCGSDCAGVAFTNTSVTLRATPTVGSVIDASGGACTWAAGSCTFTAAGLNQSVFATFTLRKQLLTVTGEGFGYTTSGPGGIDCGSVPGHPDCTELYDYGTVVALTPFAGTDSLFVSWTGCSRLNGSVCLVDMTSNRTVHKKFAAARTLSVAASGNGGGRISAPLTPPLTCIGNCSVSRLVTLGSSVVLTGQPEVGSRFGWVGGDCTGTAPCTALMSANRSAVGQFTLNRHGLVVTNRPNGSVTGTFPAPDAASIDCGSGGNLCSTVQNYGTPVLLEATADPGNTFVNWTGTSPCSLGARATNASCAFALQGNVSVIPNFRLRTVVSVLKDGNGAGTITGPGINCGSRCSEPQFDGKPVTLTASPAVGSRFDGFGGACVSNSSTCTFVPATSGQNVSATFSLRRFAVSVANDPSGHVSNPFAMADDIDCGGGIGSDCTATLDYNTPVILQADADPLHVFVKWTGSVCVNSTNSSCTFKIPLGNVSLAPVYRLRTNVTVMKDGNGAGTVVSTPAGVNCLPNQSQCSADFFDGKLVTLRATPAGGSRFLGFSDACTSNTSVCTYTPAGQTEFVHAEFALLRLGLNVTSRNQGTVSSVPGVINCGVGSTPCSDVLDYGTNVQLFASPEPGFSFVNWTGIVCTGGNTNDVCGFKLTANTTVTPNFRRRTEVVVQRDGDGTGIVTGTGIACGTDCSVVVFDGKALTLTATAAAGSRFVAWSGPCSGSNTSACTFTPVGDQQVVPIEFARQPQALTVNVNGPGTVSGVAPPCDAGSSPCAYAQLFGDQVVLQAAASASARFISWSGCTSVAGPSCTVLLNANKSVTATFQPEFTLSVSPSGNATGLVTAPGIDCGSDCSEIYLGGTMVTLTRTLPVGATFQWLGDCAFRGANTSCTLTMDQNRSVGAQFQLQQFAVTVNKTGSGQGRVLGLGTTCDLAQSTCTAIIDYGTPVVLTTDVTGASSTFDGWSGSSCTGAGSCNLSVTANRTVSAAFNLAGAVTVTVGPGGQRTFSADSVTITAGQTVRWEWASSNHDVVSGTGNTADNEFCSPDDTNCATFHLTGPGTIYTHTFTTPGTYPYFCHQHGGIGMRGTVIVNP